MLTKNGVIKSGSRLGRFDDSHEMYAHDMEILSEWRRAHVAPMKRLNTYARKRVKGVEQAIVAQRLKRIPTIISKLKDSSIPCDPARELVAEIDSMALTLQKLKLFTVSKKQR